MGGKGCRWLGQIGADRDEVEEAESPYLQILDFRQNLRAKRSKFPAPPSMEIRDGEGEPPDRAGDNGAHAGLGVSSTRANHGPDAQHMHNTCVADVPHVHRTPAAEATHLRPETETAGGDKRRNYPPVPPPSGAEHRSAGSPGDKSPLRSAGQRRTGNPRRKRQGTDYAGVDIPQIDDYPDIYACADPVIAAMAVTGESDKRAYGHWVKWYRAAIRDFGSDDADREFYAVLATLWGEIQAGEVEKPGALLNRKLTEILPLNGARSHRAEAGATG